MRKVTRPAIPESLLQNADRWQQELTDALEAQEQDHSLIRKCQNRYRQDDIREALEEMYGGLCCYCESKTGIADFSHIEHRKPKNKYPKLTFDWDNLHLACPVCNRSKGTKWDDCYPILDSSQDKIPEHLSYRIGGGGAKRWPESCRGKTTIDHAKLNRQKLVDARTEIAHGVLCARKAIRNGGPSMPAVRFIQTELETKGAGEYGSLVSWLLDANL